MPPHIPARELWWLAAGGAGYGARYARLRLRLALARERSRTSDPTGELLRLQTLYGYNAHSLVSVAPGARVWSAPEIDGAIIYCEFGRVWLAAGDPVASEAETAELARRFVAAARRAHRVAAFIPVTERFARIATRESGLCAVKIAAAPYFDLNVWAPRGDRAKKMRGGVNQALRAGVVFDEAEQVTEELRRETVALCGSWLRSRRAATGFGWLLALDPFRHAEHKKFFTARNAEGHLVGLLAASPMPARGGWYLEDVLRRPDAPAGTADLLVVEALKRLREAGGRLATLGTAPLAPDGDDDISTPGHVQSRRAIRLVAARLGSFYNFAGVRRFKSKFAPTRWESEYVLVPKGVTIPTRVAYALVRAVVPGGIVQLLARQVARDALRKARGKKTLKYER
jgi:phosphatidylglycerol lysyltransferase